MNVHGRRNVVSSNDMSGPMFSRRWLLAWVLCSAILFLGYSAADLGPTFDLRADRLVAKAVADGIDPYVPVADLADGYESRLDWTHVHPRTPGALVLQLPLAVVPEGWLRLISNATAAIALSAVAALAARATRDDWRVGVVVALAVGVSSVAVEAVVVGAQTPVMAALLVVAWVQLRDGDAVLPGVMAAIAITLKVFPWLLLVPLVALRRKAAAAALITMLGLNGVGLALPAISLNGALEAFRSVDWSGGSELNGSIAKAFDPWLGQGGSTLTLAAVGFLLVATVVGWQRGIDRVWFATLGVSVVCSPLLWRHYLLVLVPGFVWLWSQASPWQRTAAAAGGFWLLVPAPSLSVALAVPLGVLVTAAVVASKTDLSLAQQPPNR